MVETIKKATCDRCGKECYHIEEKIFNKKITNPYTILGKSITKYCFHYSTISLKTHDSRYGESMGTEFDLCGSCVDELGDWLKEKEDKK